MNICRMLTLFACWLTAGVIQAQPAFPYERMDSIEVLQFGLPLTSPWAGGLNAPTFSALDLDGDGFKDLVAFDAHSNTVKTFLNEGIANQASYLHAPEYESQFPSTLQGWILLRDYNCDGKEDLFGYRNGGIQVYKNVTPTGGPLAWQLITTYLPATIFGNPSGVYCSPIDIPAIDDIDGDGDLDILSYMVGGIQIRLYQNISTNCDSMNFVRIESCWGEFYENALNDSIILFASCKGGGGSTGNPNRHTGATLTTLDMDGDGDKDLITGDVESTRVLYLENGGDNFTAQMISVDYQFPANSVGVNLQEFNGAYHLDVNNDGKKDLLISPSNDPYSDDVDNVWYYRNDGTPPASTFTYSRKNFLVKDMVDLGTGNFPKFADVNQDGLMDILVGNIGYYQFYDFNLFVPVYESKLGLFLNVGDSITPQYEFATDDYLNLSQLGLDGMYPTLGDLDGDGDDDMIVGDMHGNLHYLTNTAGAGNPYVFSLTTSNYMLINDGTFATPELYDLDGDSLLDLVIGEYNGTLNYHKNEGTASSAFFAKDPIKDSLGGVVHYTAGFPGRVSAHFAPLDSTGQTHLIVGTDGGEVVIYDDIDNNLFGTFNQVSSFDISGGFLSVHAANINQTDSLEIIIGQLDGGMALFALDFTPDTTGGGGTNPIDTTCLASSNLNANTITEQSAILTWTAGGGDTWNVQWGGSGFTLGSGQTFTGLTSPSYPLTGLEDDSTYSFYVQDSCLNKGQSNWIGPYSFTTLQDTDTTDTTINSVPEAALLDASRLRFYPNPTADDLTVELNASEPAVIQMRVTDLTGRTLLDRKIQAQPGENRWIIELEAYSNGLYLLNLESGGQQYVQRIVKR